VARALATAAGLESEDAVDLAGRVGRGARSALGVHGFDRGGFLVEAGKRGEKGVAPLVVCCPFPEMWRVVVVLPPWGQGLHGEEERRAVKELGLRPPPPETTDRLCRLVLLGMLPALAEQDLNAFGEAVYEFNRRVGEMFRPVQRGIYAHPGIEEMVAFIREQGVAGVGQSSWGPGTFAILGGDAAAEELAGHLRRRFRLGREQVFSTRASDRGALVDTNCSPSR
jgi:beta-RFAP synthase